MVSKEKAFYFIFIMCVSLIQAMQLPMPILGSVSTDRDFFGFIYFKTRGFQT